MRFSALGISIQEKGIISYLTPMAQALLNRKVGEEVEFEMDGVKKSYRIEAIQPCQMP